MPDELEPGVSELRLKAEPPRRPLRRAPGRGEHDREDDEDLAPEDLGRGQVALLYGEPQVRVTGFRLDDQESDR